jgi:DNA primase
LLSRQFLDEVQARATMSALVGKRVQLTRSGREWKGLCPVHQEKTPSFYVNDDKGFAHCFGCGFHAEPIRWLTEVEGFDFLDAVRHLAEAAGMALPERTPAAQERAARVAGIRPALEAAMAFFCDGLGFDPRSDSPQCKAVQAYLGQRGISEQLAGAFCLGLAPEGHSYLGRIGISDADGLAAGLMWEKDGRTGARFRGRIMVPVHDARGRIVGFGGRVMPGAPSDAAKYINSPDSEIFDKGRILFNLHRAAPAIRQAKRAVVVEGYFDVIALAGVGIAEAVAPMGTALTEHQLARLWQLVRAPVLMFDGDAAGRKAARRACERALPGLAPDRTLKVALLPAGQDPDDLVRSEGREGIEAVLAEALGLDAFLFWDVVENALGTEGAASPNGRPQRSEDISEASPETRAGVWEELSLLAAEIGHDELRAEYLALWRSRYERLVSGVERAGRDLALHTVSPTEVASSDWSGDEYRFPESEDDSEKRLIWTVKRLVELRAEERRLLEPIREERKFARELAKLAGLRLPQIDAVVKMIEADLAEGSSAGRHDGESVLVLYRRVLGIKGPLTEALLPVVIDTSRPAAPAHKALPAPPRAASALAWHDAGGM